MNEKLTQERLKEVLHYEPTTGSFTWLKSGSGKRKNKRAGCIDNQTGCLRIMVDNKIYLAHHLSLLYVEGVFPKDWVGHKNKINSDNTFSNIYKTSRKIKQKNRLQNKNNTSGNNGVYLKKDVNKWVANIRINGRLKHLGIFSDIDEAIIARKNADAEFGYHQNHEQIEEIK